MLKAARHCRLNAGNSTASSVEAEDLINLDTTGETLLVQKQKLLIALSIEVSK